MTQCRVVFHRSIRPEDWNPKFESRKAEAAGPKDRDTRNVLELRTESRCRSTLCSLSEHYMGIGQDVLRLSNGTLWRTSRN